jgi:hypothetical protein
LLVTATQLLDCTGIGAAVILCGDEALELELIVHDTDPTLRRRASVAQHVSVLPMALIHNAQLAPSKLELLGTWLPSQPWWARPGASAESVGAYRFDDPAGEVGIETLLVNGGDGQILQVPLTYRGAPLESADNALVGTLQHSVLGRRWVYDACFDPVYVTALATVIFTGGTQAELEIASETGLLRREPTTRVAGSGAPGVSVAPINSVTSTTDQRSTTIRAGDVELVMRRVLNGELVTGDALTLTGVWPGNDEPVVLALARTS